MFRPTDEGLQYPLQWKNYHGRIVILSADGRELFKMEVIRMSTDTRKWLEEWAQWICDKSAGEKIEETVEDVAVEEKRPVEVAVKKKRGRPKKKK